MTNTQREKFLIEAKAHEDMRDELARSSIENFKYINSQIADWYIALAAVCFAIGGIAISVARNNIAHPAFFWWGSVLLIANGVFIFFVRKVEFDKEGSRFVDLKQNEADLWTMSKIAFEHADGDSSRASEFGTVATRFVKDYDNASKAFRWWQWAKFVISACRLDIVFGLLFFPILMLASQLQNYPHITLATYCDVLWGFLGLYVVYMVFQVFGAVKDKRKMDAADRQIKAEVDKSRMNYTSDDTVVK